MTFLREEVTAGGPESDAAQAGSRRRALRIPLSVGVATAWLLFGAAWLLAGVGHRYNHYADQALIEMAVREAAHFHRLLGPYSRFGFNHPGPAYFYALAPLYRLTGQASRSLFLSTFLLNGACLVAVVVVVRRRMGEGAARWALFVVGAYAFLLTPQALWGVWNPLVLGPPLLLLMVLVAVGWTGDDLGLVAGVLVGSFIVQTHVGLAPVVVPLLVTGGVGWWLRRRQRRPLTRRRLVAGVTIAAVTAVMWVPPLLDQLTNEPGNLGKITLFFRTDGASETVNSDRHERGHSLVQSVKAVGRLAAVVPLGPDPLPDQDRRNMEPEPVHVPRVGATALAFVLGVALVGYGWRRRRPMIAGLGMVTVVGLGCGVFAASRVIGPLMPYLLWWTAALPVPAYLGAGLLLRDVLGGRLPGWLPRRAPATVMAFVAAVPLLGFAWQMHRANAASFGGTEDRHELADLLVRRFDITRSKGISLDTSDDVWMYGYAVLDELTKRGLHVQAAPRLRYQVGDHFVETDAHQDLVIITAVAERVPPHRASNPQLVTTFADLAVWVQHR